MMSQTTSYPHLEVRRNGPVYRACINRPKVLNALNTEVLQELSSALAEAVAKGARVFVLEGSGDKAFVAGADIAGMREMSPDVAFEFSRLGQNLTLALNRAPLVTIAKVQGYALGGGLELAMACDIVLASERAVFAQPEADLGLVPGFGGTQRLVRRIGLPRALGVLLGGRKLKADKAFHLGLVTEVSSHDELENCVTTYIKAVLKAGPQAIADSKTLAHQAFESPLIVGLAAEAHAFSKCFAREEALEGMSSFLEKRPARFS